MIIGERMEFDPITITAEAPKPEPSGWDYVNAILQPFTPKPPAATTTSAPRPTVAPSKPFPWLLVGLGVVTVGALVFAFTRPKRSNPRRRYYRRRRR